jgi:predicted transcriptional regulator
MSGSTTLSIRLAPKTKQRLGRLARQTKRTKSFLAGEAIESYVERELAVVEGIERALADAKSGNVVTHDAAMRRIRATIARAKRTKNSAR